MESGCDDNDRDKNKATKSGPNSAGPIRANPSPPDRVINLAVYKIKKSLQAEGFDLVTDTEGRLTLAVRLNRS